MIKEREPAIERISVVFQVGFSIMSYFVVLWASGLINSILSLGNKEYLVMAIIIAPIWFGLLELLEL
jgi:hypothetical protein